MYIVLVRANNGARCFVATILVTLFQRSARNKCGSFSVCAHPEPMPNKSVPATINPPFPLADFCKRKMWDAPIMESNVIGSNGVKARKGQFVHIRRITFKLIFCAMNASVGFTDEGTSV